MRAQQRGRFLAGEKAHEGIGVRPPRQLRDRGGIDDRRIGGVGIGVSTCNPGVRSVVCSRPISAAPVVSRNSTSSVSMAPSTRFGHTPAVVSAARPSNSEAGETSVTATGPASTDGAGLPRRAASTRRLRQLPLRTASAATMPPCTALESRSSVQTTMSFCTSRASCGRMRPGGVGKSRTATPDRAAKAAAAARSGRPSAVSQETTRSVVAARAAAAVATAASTGMTCNKRRRCVRILCSPAAG